MFCDFDKVFHPEIEWQDVKLSDQCPCTNCEVTKERDKYLHQIAMSEGWDKEFTEKCKSCASYWLWFGKCVQKLKWYENSDERFK